MSQKEQMSLEETVKSVRKGTVFPEHETLKDYQTKALKIARKYNPDATLDSVLHGKGIRIIIKGRPITVCKRQKGHEEVISKGVFNEAIKRISNAADIPYDQLELYFLGRGKLYKSFKRRFEEEYDL